MFFWKYRKEQFDIVHWFQPRLYPFFWFVPVRKVVVTAHGGGDITAASSFVFSREVFNFIMKHFNRYIDACIGVSRFAKEEIIQSYRIAREKVFVTYNGGGEDYTNLDKEEARNAVKLPHPYILDVSRFIPHKNISNLIKAYIKAKKDYGVTQDLVIVGYQGPTYKECVELAKSTDSIHFIEYVEEGDLNALYAGADLFVFPSLNEGFGLPVVEAMASGTPVVTSNMASMPEIGGDAVLLANPNDVEDIAQKINEALSRPDLIQKGLERAKEFTWAKTAEETKKIYNTILQ